MDPLLARIVEFLRSIGMEVRLQPISVATVLPGVTIDAGALIIDEADLAHVGDALHEAGHIAITPAADRPALGINVGSDGGNEMGAMAWSYAAALELGIDPAVVFHDAGYRGGAQALIDGYTGGHNIGAPMLAWRGLTTEAGYPAMTSWLAD